MAPEVASSKQYTNSVDIWALGIIMHMLLTEGRHPFYEKETDDVESFRNKLQNMKKVELDPTISDLAKSLLERLLNPASSHRYSAKDALRHPWITRKSDNTIPMSLTEQVSSFELESRLLQSVRIMHFMAFTRMMHLSRDQQSQLLSKYTNKVNKVSSKINKWYVQTQMHKNMSFNNDQDYYAPG